MQMLVRLPARTAGNCILSCFQLHNHAGKTLRESVVNIPCHPISFFENRGPPALLGELIELKRKHDLMGECLRQFDFLGPIKPTIEMANTDKTPDLSADQNRNCQKSFRAHSLKILTPLAINARIS